MAISDTPCDPVIVCFPMPHTFKISIFGRTYTYSLQADDTWKGVGFNAPETIKSFNLSEASYMWENFADENKVEVRF